MPVATWAMYGPDVVFAGDWQGRLHGFDVKGKKLSATVPLATAQ